MFINFDYEKDLLNLADAVGKEENIEEQLWLLKRAHSHYPASVAVLVKLAEVLIACNEVNEALTLVQRAISLNQNSPLPFAFMARYYLGLGQVQEAKETLLKGMALVPNNQELELLQCEVALQLNLADAVLAYSINNLNSSSPAAGYASLAVRA